MLLTDKKYVIPDNRKSFVCLGQVLDCPGISVCIEFAFALYEKDFPSVFSPEAALKVTSNTAKNRKLFFIKLS